MALDELFAVSPSRTPPEVRRWQALARGRRMECEFLRRRDGLDWEPARIQITFPETDLPPEQTVPWDLAIDDWLLEQAVRAVSPENESERFGFRLDALLEPIEDRYGDGYFNSVLITYLKESDFAERPKLSQKLDAVHAYRPHASQTADDCRERIIEVLKTTARTLSALYPDRAVAETILCDALAYYLDDRFNISTRALLGWA